MRKSRKKLLAMILAFTMVFGTLPSNVFADNEQNQAPIIVDEDITIDESTNLENDNNSIEEQTIEKVTKEDESSEEVVTESLEEVTFEKTEEVKAGEKYIIVYNNKKALSVGKNNIIATSIEFEEDTVKTDVTRNMVWTVDENNNLMSDDNKYLSDDLSIQEESGSVFNFEAKIISNVDQSLYLTYNEETDEWSFTPEKNEEITYYKVNGDTKKLNEVEEWQQELVEEELPVEEKETLAEEITKPKESAEDATGTSNDIILTKTATEKERPTLNDRGYLYDIELSVKGKEITSNNPVDVTIVLDVSNSMTNYSSPNLTNTITAATTFINNTLKSGNNSIRVSFVKYGADAMVYNFNTKQWISNYSNISGDTNYYTYDNQTALKVLDYNTLKGGGATNTEEGFKAAKKVTSIRNRKEAQSIVLFMTDGVPTYSTQSSSGGSNTSVTEFNGAVNAGVDLKNAGNTVYTIGLLAGLNNSKILIADYLLSDQKKYTAINGNNNNNDKLENISVNDLKNRFNSSTGAYSSGYYKVTNSQTAASEMEKIYRDLASKVLSLATGTVSDIIPAEFKLTDNSKTELENAGHTVTVNNDGTTTIVFKDTVTATSTEYQLPTFTIEPNTNAYGAKYTNVSATYNYTLYDETTGSKNFNVPQGFITPLTTPDVYYTTVNSELTIDTVLNNDPSYNNKLEQGYTVTDLIYRLVDKDGNGIPSITGTNGESLTVGTDGKFKFTSPVEGTFTFYYVAEGTASNGKVLTSAPTLVTVHIYGIENKVFVIDYGKPVTYRGSDVFNLNDGSFEQNANITLNNPEGSCGTLTMDSSSKDITYTLNRYMDEIERFNFSVKKTYDSTELTLSKTVTIMPATTVYYEDNFGNTSDNDGSNGIIFTGKWISKDKDIKEGDSNVMKPEGQDIVSKQDPHQDKNYGYDSNYNNNTGLSGGSATVIKGDGETVNASFTFKGTGFDLISRTNNDTGSIIVTISKVNEDKSLTQVKNTIVNNTYYSGDLYQIPVINFYTEEYATYQVDITVGETVFYLDAIRVYNPLGFNEEAFEEAYDRYEDDGEANANIREVRNLLIASGDFNADNSISNGAVFIDAEGETPGKKTSSISDYKNLGPNNEVYLSNGQSVAFKIEGYENAASIQIGLKTPNSNTVDNNVVINKNIDATKQQLVTVKTATDMYYDITDIVKADKGLITINNLSTDILAITNIKITSGTKTTTFNIVSDQETVVIANMLAYEASNNKSADINSDGAIDIYDLADVANNQDKEVIIGVSTDIYRQDLTGTRTINRDDLNIVRDNLQ